MSTRITFSFQAGLGISKFLGFGFLSSPMTLKDSIFGVASVEILPSILNAKFTKIFKLLTSADSLIFASSVILHSMSPISATNKNLLKKALTFHSVEILLPQ